MVNDWRLSNDGQRQIEYRHPSLFSLLDLLVLVLAILDGADVKRRAIGKDESGGSQPLVSAKIDIKIGILARIVDEESVRKATRHISKTYLAYKTVLSIVS